MQTANQFRLRQKPSARIQALNYDGHYGMRRAAGSGRLTTQPELHGQRLIGKIEDHDGNFAIFVQEGGGQQTVRR